MAEKSTAAALIELAGNLAPLIVPGAANAIAAAQNAIEAINALDPLEPNDDEPALEAAREKLEAAVLAHADRTADRLKG